MSLVETRRHQMFPLLDMAQIETARRFASDAARSFAPGALAFGLGERPAPAWLVLEIGIEVAGAWARANVAAVTTHRSGQITGEVGQLAGRAALATGRAGPEGCKALPSTPPISARSWSAPRNSAR